MSKRGENIYKRKDGRWEARYPKNYSSNGEIVYGYVYGRTYLEAKTKKNQKLIGTSRSTETDQAEHEFTLKQAAEEWLEHSRLSIKESTYVKYRYILTKHILPNYGDIQLKSFQDTEVMDLCRQMQIGETSLAPKTLQDIMSVLRLIIRYGEKSGYINAGSLQVRLTLDGNMKKTDKKLKIMQFQDRLCLERHLVGQSENIRNVGILIAMYTGMRIGELCALKWQDIDLNNGIIYVDHTLQRLRDYSADDECAPKTKLVYDTPKTHSSCRDIPLPQFLTAILRDFSEIADDESYVLSCSAKPLEPRAYLYYFKRQLKLCGLPEYTFHTLRHTFATRCVEEGFDIKSLSEILGHSNVRITMDRYVHPSIETKRALLERLTVGI